MPSSTSLEQLATSLRDAGLRAEDVEAWLGLAGHVSPTVVVQAATNWAWEGIPGRDAVDWHLAGWLPRQTVVWWMMGFSPAQASYVRAALADSGAPPAQVDDWLNSGLSASDILLYVAAGVPNADRAKDMAGRLNAEPALRGSLRMRAVLQGVDVSLLDGRRE